MKNLNKIILSLGSNIGNREHNLKKAIEFLKGSVFFEEKADLLKISAVYETEPYGIKEQNHFLNLSISGYTDLSPGLVLNLSKSIEYFLDRQNRGKWLEREIDIDLIFFGNQIININRLKVPHPLLEQRRFVLLPTNEIEHDFVHPVTNLTVNEILSKCESESSIIRYKNYEELD